MMKRRSPWLTLVVLLVYTFLYIPILVLVVYAFNASRANVRFEGIVNQGPCGPFYWFCVLGRNRDVLRAAENTLVIAIISKRLLRWRCHRWRRVGRRARLRAHQFLGRG
jgi:spermidine/putrescine transport system permease protein